eukprot:tig00001127_g7147.t1
MLRSVVVARPVAASAARPLVRRASSAPAAAVTPASHCAEMVRSQDREQFLVGLFYPDAARPSFYALRAFNIETARIADVAKGSVDVGRLRMQWWREAVDAIYKDAPPHMHVTQMLHHAVRKHKLSRRWLDRLLDAREKDLVTGQPVSVEDLEAYAENTASSLAYLALETCGVRNVHADHAASHLGKASGLVSLIRGTPFHASKGRIYIPRALCAKYDVKPEDVKGGKSPPNVREALFELASRANSHLQKARAMAGSVPKESLPVLRAAIPVEEYLERLRKADFDAFDSGVASGPPLPLQLRLTWARIRSTF